MASKRDEEFARMCRVDGRKPTTRDKWRAFHRLWRLSQGHGVYQDMAAADCFRVLFSNWEAIRLLNGDATRYSLVDTSRVPKFLRKRLLEDRRRQRLYQGHYEWMERDKAVSRKVREEQGIETTPLEVAEVRRKVIQLARAKAAEMDFPVPDDDEELLRLLRATD